MAGPPDMSYKPNQKDYEKRIKSKCVTLMDIEDFNLELTVISREAEAIKRNLLILLQQVSCL